MKRWQRGECTWKAGINFWGRAVPYRNHKKLREGGVTAWGTSIEKGQDHEKKVLSNRQRYRGKKRHGLQSEPGLWKSKVSKERRGVTLRWCTSLKDMEICR